MLEQEVPLAQLIGLPLSTVRSSSLRLAWSGTNGHQRMQRHGSA